MSFKKKHFLVINDNGDAFLVTPTGDTYNDLSTLVDGYYEAAETALAGTTDAWVNEEGLLRPENDFALNLVGRHIVRYWTGKSGYQLVGPVVFAGFDTETGNTLPCPAEFIAHERNEGLMFMDGVWTVEECAARMQQSRDIYTEWQAVCNEYWTGKSGYQAEART